MPTTNNTQPFFRCILCAQKKKFTSLGGSAEGTGDLRSVVLHDMTMTHVSSDFPMPVGANITAVDANTYSVTGEAFGYIAPANSTSTVSTKLQADDTSLAYAPIQPIGICTPPPFPLDLLVC